MGPAQAVISFLLLAFTGSLVEGHMGCYYGTWAYTRPGMGEFWPEDIDVDVCDVIYYGFGNILNDTYEVCSWDPWFDMAMSDGADGTIQNCVQERDGDAWPVGCVTDGGLDYCHYDGIRRTIALKEKNPNLKVLFSVGGWTAGGWIFSKMAETKANRNKFVHSIVHFVKYFGFDGVDLDWEYPGFDMWPEVPTNPADREHFTLLLQELREKFDLNKPEPLLITIASATDPYKAGNAYEMDKIHLYLDWINIMSYDFAGPWDNFTGIEAPLYGRWGEGFQGHPKYQFNIYESIMFYINSGIPPEKISLGIHTESKGWVLAEETPETSALYCPCLDASPNMTYSRQPGWLYYYEILQFWHNETIEEGRWSDLEPGRDKWTIYDHENGNQDGCYMAPYMYQGRYWISYDDEYSVDLKARFANHWGLKGAFIWEIDNDNFQGLGGKEKFTILHAINNALESGAGLTPEEQLGSANENQNCSPQAPMCEPFWTTVTPSPTEAPCQENSDCNEDNSVVCNDAYDNCFYCDEGECKPGCSDDQNCPDSAPTCNGDNKCQGGGEPLVRKVTVNTQSCDGCSYANVEQGLQLHLVGKYNTECSTDSLDNPDMHDYIDNHEAIFFSGNSSIGDHGMGECANFDLDIGLTAATAAWTGAGSWTPMGDKHICVNFYDPNNNKPTCCCNLIQASLSSSMGPVDLDCTNSCFI